MSYGQKFKIALFAVGVEVNDDALTVALNDGRTISAPLAWYPRLLHATTEERGKWRLIGKGQGIHWEALDEDISVEDVLAGRRLGESQTSQIYPQYSQGNVGPQIKNSCFSASNRL